MDTEIIQVVYLALGFTSAAVGGVSLSFSDFVMRGFAQADEVSAIDSMQGLRKWSSGLLNLSGTMGTVVTKLESIT